MKDYGYRKHKVVYFKLMEKYSENSNATSFTDDITNAIFFMEDISNEDIIKRIDDKLKEQVVILDVILSVIVL